MATLSPAKSNQLIVTGILQALFGSATFAFVYLLYGETFSVNGYILRDETAAYWTAVPMITVGLVGVLAGIAKHNCLINLYLVGSTLSCALGALVCVTVGIKVNAIRAECKDKPGCKNSSAAMLLGTLVLFASLVVVVALWGAVKACQAKWGPSKKTQALRVIGEYQADGACVQNHESAPTSIIMVNHPAAHNPPRDEPTNRDRGVVNPALEEPAPEVEATSPQQSNNSPGDGISIDHDEGTDSVSIENTPSDDSSNEKGAEQTEDIIRPAEESSIDHKPNGDSSIEENPNGKLSTEEKHSELYSTEEPCCQPLCPDQSGNGDVIGDSNTAYEDDGMVTCL